MLQVIDYTVDRMYCESELNGNPTKGVEQGLVKLKELFASDNYSLEETDEKYGNTILHWIADQGLFEFYELIKQHPEFDNIKNKTNKFKKYLLMMITIPNNQTIKQSKTINSTYRRHCRRTKLCFEVMNWNLRIRIFAKIKS
mgnify:CR=1 FL=1